MLIWIEEFVNKILSTFKTCMCKTILKVHLRYVLFSGHGDKKILEAIDFMRLHEQYSN